MNTAKHFRLRPHGAWVFPAYAEHGSRFALTQALSLRLRRASARQAGERGNFSGCVEIRSGVYAQHAIGASVPLHRSTGDQIGTRNRSSDRPRSFLPLPGGPGGEGRGEGGPGIHSAVQGLVQEFAGTKQPAATCFRPLLASLLFLVFILVPGVAGAAFVYETPAEFLTSGDFNGDGVPDALVLDKSTGNARVGYDNGAGQLNWVGPFATGAENVTGCAVGRFITTAREAIAVTSPELNRVLLVDLLSPSATPTNVYPAGVGPHGLAALRAPFGSPLTYPSLLVASSANSSNSERADLLTLNAGVASPAVAFAPGGRFERLNSLEFGASGATLAAGMIRGGVDVFQAWRLSGVPTPVMTRGDLRPGTEYLFGRFRGEALPRLVFYVPGEARLILQSLDNGPGGPVPGAFQEFSLPGPLQRVYYAELSGAGILVLHFEDGVRGARPPTPGGTSLEFVQDFNPGPGRNYTGFAPLTDGKFALFTAPAGGDVAAQSQLFQWNGTSFGLVSSRDLPEITSAQTRATAWFFGSEPFVNREPGFIYSVSVPDWTTSVAGLPTSTFIGRQGDGGTGTGLNGGGVTNLGPTGAAFGVPNQYHPAISLFSYAGPQAADPVRVRITPTPGAYQAPVTVSLAVGVPASDIAFYRLGDGAYRQYGFAFAISNDVTISYYATNLVSRQRSRLQTATFTFGRPVAPPPLSDPAVTSNLPPVVVSGGSNSVPLSIHGTVFYGRRGPNLNPSIWAINLDGSGDRFITTGVRPRVSPDGRYLAFLREGNPFNSQGNLWMRDLISGVERRLFGNNDFLIGFNWDVRDTSTLYFDYQCGLWRTGTNGGPTALPMANDCYDDGPAVNPVDGRLAFHNLNPNAAVAGLYVTAPGGGARQRILTGTASWPAWSPDGRQIAFADSLINGVLNNGPDLFVVNPDGTGLHPITSLGGVNGFLTGAQWAPDADALVAAGYIFNTNGLWVIPLNTDRTACASTPIRLPTTPGDDIDFAGSVVAPPRQPELFIRRESGEVVVSWRRTALEFVLESTETLGVGAEWSAVLGPYAASGQFLEVRWPEGSLSATAFFRLRR